MPTPPAMYEVTQGILSAAGLPAYEVSNHAAVGAESRHNLAYWHYDDYIGIGPGAHGRHVRDGERFAVDNHRAPEVYLKQVREQGHGLRASRMRIDTPTAMRGRSLMMGLRLAQGIAQDKWREKFGIRRWQIFIAPEKTARPCEQEGYLANNANARDASRLQRQDCSG